MQGVKHFILPIYSVIWSITSQTYYKQIRNKSYYHRKIRNDVQQNDIASQKQKCPVWSVEKRIMGKGESKSRRQT